MREPEFIEAEIMTVARTDKGTAVLVRPVDTEKAVPIFIGSLEAHSILIGLQKIPMPRPLTHDLLLQVMERGKFIVERVEICDFKQETFFAKIFMRHGVKKLEFDARPSDALALVSRLGTPLFIAKDIVDEAGIPIDMITEDVSDSQPSVTVAGGISDSKSIAGIQEDPVYRRISLQHQLEEAVESEDFEEAARLRDRIKNLEGPLGSA
jgi:bifunctional DNase/RNase